MNPDNPRPLTGTYILIVDDDYLATISLRALCTEVGARVICAREVSSGIAAANSEPLTAAILDVRIGLETSEPIADRLMVRKIPFLFYSGRCLPHNVAEKYPNVPVMMKPVIFQQLLRTLTNLTAQRA